LYYDVTQKVDESDVDVLCQGHHFVFVGDDVEKFFDRSLKAAEKFQNEVQELLRSEKGSIERVVHNIKTRQYDTNKGVKKSEK
jgi:ABC-type Zn2+ transport system substrate-binding protein/surface adhesin